MSRQYIGARYVPKFADPVEWSANKLYNESMIMVTYLNQTYTSRKPVPLGTPPTNTEYWALTGAVNEQLNEIQTDVNNLKNDVADNTTDINNLQSGLATTNTNVTNLNNKVTTAQTDITGLRADVTTAQTDITGLRADVTTAQTDITGLQTSTTSNTNLIINNHRSIINGDTILIGDSLANGLTNKGWAVQFKNKYINGNTTILATGGAGFASGTPTFVTALTTQYNNMTPTERNNIKNIICFGGINDLTATRENMTTGVNGLINIAKQFLNARIFIAPLNTFKVISPAQYSLLKIISDRASMMGIETTSQFLLDFGGWKQYTTDNVHLIENAEEWFAGMLFESVKGNKAPLDYFELNLFNPVASSNPVFENTVRYADGYYNFKFSGTIGTEQENITETEVMIAIVADKYKYYQDLVFASAFSTDAFSGSPKYHSTTAFIYGRTGIVDIFNPSNLKVNNYFLQGRYCPLLAINNTNFPTT